MTSSFDENKAECLKLFEENLSIFRKEKYFKCLEYTVHLKYPNDSYHVHYSDDDCLKDVRKFIKSIKWKKNG